MKKRFAALLAGLLAAALAAAPGALAAWQPPQGAVNAEAVYLYNLDTETVVYEKNAYEVRAAASLTKMMTGLLLAESGEDLSATVTISEELRAEFDRIQAENGSDADLKIGETLTLESLLYACMLPSGNDAASVIAWYLGNGDMQAFFDRMNERAAALGCRDTNFTCAHGLYGLEYGNRSTAYDLFLIARAVRENELLMEVVTRTGYWMPQTNLHPNPEDEDAPEGAAYYIGTTNVMQLPDQALYRPYIRGIKTGFTNEAGRCFASSAESGGMTWLLVVLGAPRELADDGFNYAFHTTANLYDWALANFFPAELPSRETPLAQVELAYCAESGTVPLYAAESLATLQTASSEVEIRLSGVPDSLEAPVQAHSRWGEAAVYVDGELAGTVTLEAIAGYDRSGWLYFKAQLAPHGPLLLAAAALAAALLAAGLLFARRRSRKNRRHAVRR